MTSYAFRTEPNARATDPMTSHEAAESATDLAERHKKMILEALRKHGPMGKDSIATRTGLDGVQVARRMKELETADLAEPTGKRVPSATGRSEREWRALGM